MADTTTQDKSLALTILGEETEEESALVVPTADAATLARFKIFGDVDKANEVREQNLKGKQLSLRNMPTIGTPPNGQTKFTLKTPLGEKQLDQLVGIIVAVHEHRYYYADAFNPANVRQPDCASNDSEYGVGKYGTGSEENPTGMCAMCPMGQWHGNTPPACRQGVRLFMLRPGQNYPTVINLGRASLSPWNQYMLQLSIEMLPYSQVITRITVVPDKKQTGRQTLQYNRFQFEAVATLPEEAYQQIKTYGETVKAIIPGNKPQTSSESTEETITEAAEEPAF